MIAVIRSVEPLAGVGFAALVAWGVVEWALHVAAGRNVVAEVDEARKFRRTLGRAVRS